MSEVVKARNDEIGTYMGSLKTQLQFHASKKQLITGDAATVEAVVRELAEYKPDMVNVAIWFNPNGDYYTSEGVRGNAAGRDYLKTAFRNNFV